MGYSMARRRMRAGEVPTSSLWRGAAPGGASARDYMGEASPKLTQGAHPSEEEADPTLGVAD